MREVTRALKPETVQREVAMATLERESWLRWPTIISDTTSTMYCDTVTATIGAAIHVNFFSSSIRTTTTAHRHVEPEDSLDDGAGDDLVPSSSFIFICFFPSSPCSPASFGSIISRFLSIYIRGRGREEKKEGLDGWIN